MTTMTTPTLTRTAPIPTRTTLPGCERQLVAPPLRHLLLSRSTPILQHFSHFSLFESCFL